MHAKVSLSDIEMQLVSNAEWILTKNRIIQKVYELFGQLSELYKHNTLLQILPPETILQSPKIFKGEQYEGLPYVMLDYPRCFGKEDILAVRTFFWWGNYFTITLQLKGMYKQLYQTNIAKQIKEGNLAGAFINVGEDEWVHHLLPSNMKPITIADANTIAQKQTVKLVYQLKLAQWNEAETFLSHVFDQYMKLMAGN
jgi:hypothetical protein